MKYSKGEANDNMVDSISFKFKANATKKTITDNDSKAIQIPVILKLFGKFWRILEMLIINCKINPILTWKANNVVSATTGATKFPISDSKLYVPVVTSSNRDDSKLL